MKGPPTCGGCETDNYPEATRDIPCDALLTEIFGALASDEHHRSNKYDLNHLSRCVMARRGEDVYIDKKPESDKELVTVSL